MKKQVAVTRVVEVEVDETKFTEDFMREFRASIREVLNKALTIVEEDG